MLIKSTYIRMERMMTTKQKQLLKRIKREVKAGYKGMNEFEESL